MTEEKRASILEHLRELQRRLILSVIAVAITTIIAAVFAGHIFHFLLKPLGEHKVTFIDVTEMLSTYFRVSLYAGVAGALPFVLYQILAFVSPALTPRERRYAFLLLPGIVLSFAAGVAFGYYVLLPPAIRFLLGFGSDIATPEIRISNYISVITGLLFWIGVVFETPLLFYFLARIHLVNPRFLARRRRYIVILAFILAAIITPTPDPVNQTLVAVPLIVLFEMGIWLGRLGWRQAPTSPGPPKGTAR